MLAVFENAVGAIRLAGALEDRRAVGVDGINKSVTCVVLDLEGRRIAAEAGWHILPADPPNVGVVRGKRMPQALLEKVRVRVSGSRFFSQRGPVSSSMVIRAYRSLRTLTSGSSEKLAADFATVFAAIPDACWASNDEVFVFGAAPVLALFELGVDPAKIRLL